MLSLRALLLLVLPAMLLVAGSVAAPFVLVGWVAVVVVLGLLVADWALAQRPRDFELSRHHENKLSLGADNAVAVRVVNRSGRPARVVVRDEPPDEFDISARLLPGEVSPRDTWEGRYTLHPYRRGDYRFGDLHLRWEGPLGLVSRQARYPTGGEVKVYPNLLEVRKYDLLARSGRLWQMGLRRVNLLGRGTEFERLREYTPDDEYRQIHWKATARRGKPISVQYQTERSQTVIALLDTGRLMRAPVGRLAKLDYAVNTVLLLSYVAMRRGDQVGALAFADDVDAWLPPRSGHGQFYRMLETLYNVESQPTVPDIPRAISFLKAKRPRRALIVLFTDLSGGSDPTEMVAALASLRPHHLPLVVTMNDPGVLALAQQPLMASTDVYERAVANQVLGERRLILDQLERQGALTIDVPAEKLTVSVINKYLELKGRGLL